MTLFELYSMQKADGRAGEGALALLRQTHWFAVNAEFDPKTGDALPQALSAFLAKVSRADNVGITHDRLWRITEHARPSIERLLRVLNESPRREQALLPIHAVRELDANSFIKLSNRPGRNIREKLSGKPYLQAVRRFQSVNLPENRLLKVFVTRLAELMELRRDCLGEEEDELVTKIHSWLRSDEAQAIARWDNLPPNNTLLSHRDYRRIWDAWRWIQSLDGDIARDLTQLESRGETMREWQDYGRLYLDGKHFFAEQPVLFDYEEFAVRPWCAAIMVRDAARKIGRSSDATEILEPACVDLAILHPRYATGRIPYGALPKTYLWQQWKRNKEAVDIDLFNSDAAYLHSDASSVASTDLFYSKEKVSDHLLDRAARAFAGQLRKSFKNDSIAWLTPDFLDDFELEILRRNLNARFPRAEPLPRSVAAVFEQVDHSKINRDGLAVIVIDYIGGKTCVVKLIARFDPELKERFPETRGFYWERCPPLILRDLEIRRGHQDQKHAYDLLTLDSTGHWHVPDLVRHNQHIAPETLKRDPRIGQFDSCIDLKKSPVAGGARLQSLQQQAGNTPLWRDQIPELSIKVMIGGLYQRFYLVEQGTTVKPIRGKSVSIRIHKTFILPFERPFYQFPLFRGENADELGFSARLDSPDFPLKKDPDPHNKGAECRLNLTFEYGADEPYKLVFVPLDQSFPPVRATWKRTEEIIITDAPAPKYPEPMTWEGLRHFPNTLRGGTIDLIQKLISTAANFNKWLDLGDDDAWNKIEKNIKGWCRFLLFAVWRDGRSISDSRCPTKLSASAKDLLATLGKVVPLLVAKKNRNLHSGVMVLFCALHKDMPEECVQWITEQSESGNIRDPRAVGFALGDVSEDWQQSVFNNLVSKPNFSIISVFAYAIWREQHFVERFSISELRGALETLSKRLAKINAVILIGDKKKDEWAVRNWVRATAEPLELLLGLLRARSSMDPDIKMLLQPQQKITKQLAEKVERVAEIVAESNVGLFSRVQINVKKPEGDRTPDLLYALRLYLTGDDGANAIHITSVSDSDDG